MELNLLYLLYLLPNEMRTRLRCFARARSVPLLNAVRYQVGVIGLGLMGHGIVQVTAMASPKFDVVAVEASQEAIDMGRNRIDRSLQKMASRKIKQGALTAEDAKTYTDEIVSRISYTTDKGALAHCNLVVEAVPENVDMKLQLFKDLAAITRPECILASNTSSLTISVSTTN